MNTTDQSCSVKTVSKTLTFLKQRLSDGSFASNGLPANLKKAVLPVALSALLSACGSSNTVDPEDVLQNTEASSTQSSATNNSEQANVETDNTDEGTSGQSENQSTDGQSTENQSPDNQSTEGDNSGQTNTDQGSEQTNQDSEPQEQTTTASETVFTSSSNPGFTGTILDDGNIQLQWPAVDGAKGYNVYRAGEYLTSVSDASYTDTDISQSSYYYEIDSYDFNDNIENYAEGLTVNLTPALGAALAGDNASSQLPEHIQTEYDLVFSEEFQADSLDTTKWNTSYLWGADLFINSEEQYYVDIKNDPDFGFNPFSFDGEIMTINSIRTPDDLLDKAKGQKYLSGVITSYDSFQFTYGYVEARVKVPFGQGFWSAFWLLNAYYVDQKPEIDIMEHIGNDRDVAFHTYHYYDADGQLHSTKAMETIGVDFTAEFHTFAVEWKPGKIIFYVDGIERHSVSDPTVSSQSMYIIANTALGGWWPGPPDEWTPFPANYKIDYIRAYQKRGVQEDQPYNDGIQTIPLADDVPGNSPNHIPDPSQWPNAWPELRR